MKNFLLFATGISFCIFISCQQTSSHKPFVELSSLELSEEEMPMVSISNDFACSFFQKMNAVSYTHLTLPTSDLV